MLFFSWIEIKQKYIQNVNKASSYLHVIIMDKKYSLVLVQRKNCQIVQRCYSFPANTIVIYIIGIHEQFLETTKLLEVSVLDSKERDWSSKNATFENAVEQVLTCKELRLLIWSGISWIALLFRSNTLAEVPKVQTSLGTTFQIQS